VPNFTKINVATANPIATKFRENSMQPLILEHHGEVQDEHTHLNYSLVPIDLTIPYDSGQHCQVDDEETTVTGNGPPIQLNYL
jgi:hypothetical protein